MGGFGALRNGLKYHDTFRAVICLSVHFMCWKIRKRAERTALHMKKVISEIWSKQQRVTKPGCSYRAVKGSTEKEPSVNVPTVFQACGTEDGLLK